MHGAVYSYLSSYGMHIKGKENIPFTYKTQNSTNLRRRSNLIGLNSNGLYLYYIYVHKDRFAEAQALL